MLEGVNVVILECVNELQLGDAVGGLLDDGAGRNVVLNQ